ncbi:MAG: SDR family oxidoreductase [Clostridia bacterium]|nr:SDR family oxidoreductase [Clostridia bacterium]
MALNKAVLITGASGSIGEATAKLFAENGYDIIATYNSHKISDELRDFCRACNVSLHEFKLDITQAQQVQQIFDDAFKVSGYLDCVVCNAGCSVGEKMLCDNSDDDIEKLVQTNLVGTIYCNREAVKHLLKQKHGNIINVSSIYGVQGGSCEAVYSAAKAGIIGLTKALAKELAFSAIRVNAIAPAYVETNMTACFSEEEKEAIRQENNLERLAQPQDVAEVIYEVAEVERAYNGEIVFVD